MDDIRKAALHSAVDDWLSHYEQDTREKAKKVETLRNTITTGSPDALTSALFEVSLHEVMNRLGCKLECEPELHESRNTNPDFLVTDPSGEQFVLEAYSTTGVSRQKTLAYSRFWQIVDYLRPMPRPELSMWFELVEAAPQAPRKKTVLNSIRAFIKEWEQAHISYRHQSELVNVADDITNGEWIFRIRINRLDSPMENGKILIHPTPTGVVTPVGWEPIRNALDTKAPSKYGELDIPYIVAVNSLYLTTGVEDVFQALYGVFETQIIVDLNTGKKVRTQFVRKDNGSWGMNVGEQRKSISGVLAFLGLHQHYIGQVQVAYFPHPKPRHNYLGVMENFSHYVFNGEIVEQHKGKALNEILGVEPEFPGRDPLIDKMDEWFALSEEE